MLRINLWTEVGLVNGSVGTIQGIMFEEGQGPPSLPIAVLVEFEGYNGPAIITAEGNKIVPMLPLDILGQGKMELAHAYRFLFVLRGL